jgi:hypothetical protein
MGMNYISRQQWGATPPPGGKGFNRIKHRRVKGVVVHHSGVENGPTGTTAVHAFERHHLAKGWDGIAYNWLVDETGTIYEGRGWEARGAATKRWNAKSISVCFTGHGDVEPREQVLESFQTLIREAQTRFNGTLWVSTHRRKGATTCPGHWLSGWVEGGMAAAIRPTDTDWAGIVRYFHDLQEQVRQWPLGRRWPLMRRGEPVRLVQARLGDRGFDPGPADGIFGRRTKKAVKQFQETQGFLKVSGVVDGDTFGALFIR